MKKYILLGVLLGAFVVTPALAQTQSVAELLAIIARLQAQIAALSGGGTTSSPFCWNPNWTNLRIGDRGTGVGTLQEILRREGFTIAAEERQGVSISDAEFGESTAAAVSGFQEKYADEILRPNGLARGTGYVGSATRGKLNRLHACKRPIPIPIPVPGAPSISGVSGPTSLQVGQQGTWTAKASDPNNGTLSYSVWWGDEVTILNVPGAPSTLSAAQQSATFTHIYQGPNTYYPTFTVTNASGQSAKTSISVRVGDVSQPTITVLSPNGGESYVLGQDFKAMVKTSLPTWPTASFAPVNYTLVFSLVDGPTNGVLASKPVFGETYVLSLNYVMQGDVGLAIAPGSYRLKVDLYDRVPCLGLCAPNTPQAKLLGSDTSDKFFRITSGTSTNHPPEIVSGSIPASPIPVHQSVTFGWNARDADNDDLSWSVDWGDGGGAGGAGGPCTQSGRGWTFNTSHAWSQAGTYKVTARVTDCAGASASSVTTVTVGDVVTSGLDLAVSAFELNASGPLATFCNKGTEPLKSFPVWISINSVNREFDLAGSRPAGSCSTHQWYYGTWGFNAMTSDGYYGQVTVDPNNLYAELNENNNKAEARYPILAPPPSGGGGGGGSSPAVSLSTLSQIAATLQAMRNILNGLPR